MYEPGHKLKQARERLNLRYRDVEEASIKIANRKKNDEFVIALSRLSDIENRGTVPSIFRLYSLCTIYRLDIYEVLEWYGVTLSTQAVDAANIEIGKTHLIGFQVPSQGEVLMPLSLEPGIDLKKTVLLNELIQRWGKLPLSLLEQVNPKHRRFAFVGSEDWSMYPLIRPESLLLIDDTQRKVASSGWASLQERPVYLVEHRSGFYMGWCSIADKVIVIQPHPGSTYPPQIFPVAEVDILGQIIGVASYWSQKPRNTQS